jgi:hypothetical protein
MLIEPLIVAITALVTSLSPERAREHVEAATAAATAQLPAELLLSIAYVESRYDPRALSRIECETPDPESCVRKTGVWPKATKPPRARPSWYCGPMQTGGYVPWDECQRMRTDVTYAYSVGVRELTRWLDDRRCARLSTDDRLRCALAGYNGGNAAVVDYQSSRYARWVLSIRARVEHNAARAASS